MKQLIPVLLLIFAIACKNKANEKNSTPPSTTTDLPVTNNIATIPNSTDTNWVESFKTFREAVYSNDKEKVKKFISLPITNASNEIWMLVNGDLDKLPKENTPFTEADYSKHFNKIFPKEFVDGILKVKTPNLLTKKEYTTEKLNTKDFAYTTTVRYNNDKTFTITLNQIFDSEGESAIVYIFDTINGSIKLKKVQIAG